VSEAFALEAVGVRRDFRLPPTFIKKLPVLRGCTARIPQGSIAALVGRNGAGKSTFLRIAAGMDFANTGTIEILGHRPGSKELVPQVGYVDQGRQLLEDLNVGEHLKLMEALNLRWDASRAIAFLEDLRIDTSRRVRHLSAGQRAHVALVLALAKSPKFLLLDEPVAAVDPVARQDLLQTMLTLVAESGCTVLISTHDLAEVEAFCDFLIVLRHGRFVVADDIEFVLNTHRVISRVGASVRVPEGAIVVADLSSTREQKHLVRIDQPIDESGWTLGAPTVQEVTMAYLRHSGPIEGMEDHD